jgi:hypothetical protein
MDVSFWGPPGWKLLHSITFERGNLETKKKLFYAMKDVLPCKYCRESARQFIKELPFDNNLALWLYRFHNKVNDKLNKQHAENPGVPKPAKPPSFKEVIAQYKYHTPDPSLGTNFLLSMAFNYTPDKKECHEKFWIELVKLYPQTLVVPNFQSKQTYFKSVYDMLKITQPYSEVYNEVKSHKTKCKRKKTCRKKVVNNKTRRSFL